MRLSRASASRQLPLGETDPVAGIKILLGFKPNEGPAMILITILCTKKKYICFPDCSNSLYSPLTRRLFHVRFGSIFTYSTNSLSSARENATFIP